MSKKLDNAAQMNEVEQKAGRIYERNPDSGEIRSRKAGDHGNEKTEAHPTQDEIIAFNKKENERMEYIKSEIAAAGHHDGYVMEGLKKELEDKKQVRLPFISDLVNDFNHDKDCEGLQDKMDSMHYDIQGRVRREVLNELWASNKITYNGKWYVQLSEVVNIIGDYNELEENESK